MEEQIINGVRWRPVIFRGIPTNYIVSEYSNVMNRVTGEMLTAVPYKESGRERVHLHVNGKPVDVKIYRLSYEAFYGPIPKDMTIDHIDENFLNNHISNLRLLTASENIKSYLRNHPDHGFQKVYSDEMIIKYFKKLQRGVYYRDAAAQVGIKSKGYALGLMLGRRRRDLWEQYQPFPNSAHKRVTFSKRDERIIIAKTIDGCSIFDITKILDIEYNASSINKIVKIRNKHGVRDSKFFDQSFIMDVDTLIKEGKTNNEIYDILSLSLSKDNTRISDFMARRRRLLKIPNNNFSVGNKEETELVRKYIAEGLSNDEILKKINKERNQYYINLFGKERKKYKRKCNVQRLSTN